MAEDEPPAKKKRGPKPFPRGDPAEQVNPEWAKYKRRIKYEGPEVIPVAHTTVLREHTLLNFKLGTEPSRKCSKFLNTNLLEHRNISWDMLRKIGNKERIEELVSGKWKDILRCNWPQYEELTIEFHSTFQHREATFLEPNAVSFSLGRQLHEMTIPQFALLTGFYDEDEIKTPAFMNGLRGAFKANREMCLRESDLEPFWNSIAISPFSTAMVSTDIKDPVLRFLHRILACTLVGRRSGEDKVNKLDLFCLLCMVEKREVNFASLMAWSFSRNRRGGNRAGLDMGPYITRIATRLGVFERYKKDFLTKVWPTVHYGLKDLRKAGILTFDEPPRWFEPLVVPQVVPPPGSDASREMQKVIPPKRQHRLLHRRELPLEEHELRDEPQEPRTIDGLYELVEKRFRQIHRYMEREFKKMRDLIESGPSRVDEQEQDDEDVEEMEADDDEDM